MTITEARIILVFTAALFMLVKTVPQMAAGVISGSSTGGIHLGGSENAVAGAAAAASGGAMIAMQAAGAGMALNSAYQQSRTNMAEGMDKFAGASFAGGLSGAMDKGLIFASDMI
jgi:type IV secretion system protein TrbL